MSVNEQIVPDSFKKTEIGIYPETWEVKTLAEIANIERGKFSARPRNDPKYFGGTIPFIQTGDITRSNGRDVSYSQTLNEKGLAVSRLFPESSLYFTIAANIGDVAIVNYQSACPDSLVVLKEKKLVEKEWLYHALADKKAEFEIIATSNAQLNINLEKLNPYKLCVPPKEEQTAIANALSDVDALLTELETLIAKKQAIKTATMQQLLTGKTRLPQFATYTKGAVEGQSKGTKPSELGNIPEDWEMGALGEIAKFCKGKGLPKSDISDFGMFECIHYGELFTTYGPEVRSIQSKTNSVEDTIKSEANDILMPTSDVTPTGLATASGIKKKGIILGGDILIIRPHKDKLDSSFFSYLVAISKKQIMQLVTGSTVYHLYGSDMATFKFSYPSDIDEQAGIATILSDMDNEIQTLEQRLTKTRQIKQGMMQQLLTGRTRLPFKQAKEA